VDNDCDGLVDEGTNYYDDDGDGYTEADGDCDDGDPHVHPGHGEDPDGLDNDCNGQVDEGVGEPGASAGNEQHTYEPACQLPPTSRCHLGPAVPLVALALAGLIRRKIRAAAPIPRA